MLARISTIHHFRAARPYGSLMASGPSARVSTAVRLPAELHAELQRQAHERDVSVNFLITRAVAHYLKSLGPADPLAVSPAAEGAFT